MVVVHTIGHTVGSKVTKGNSRFSKALRQNEVGIADLLLIIIKVKTTQTHYDYIFSYIPSSNWRTGGKMCGNCTQATRFKDLYTNNSLCQNLACEII